MDGFAAPALNAPPPAAARTWIRIRRPTRTPKTGRAKPTSWLWPPRAASSLSAKAPALTQLEERKSPSSWKTLIVAPPANWVVPARAACSRVARRIGAYMASRATRACSRVGCYRAKAHVREGIPLCDEHSRPAVTWHDELPDAPTARSRSPSLGRIAPSESLSEDPPLAPARAWIRWSEPGAPAEHAYYAFGFQLMGRAADGTRQNPRMSIYLPDLDLTFSIPSDLAAGGINAGQADQMVGSRAPVVVDPPWSGTSGHNRRGEPFPYSAAQSLIRGDYPEAYAMHHLGRILPAAEQPQPSGSPRGTPRDRGFASSDLVGTQPSLRSSPAATGLDSSASGELGATMQDDGDELYDGRIAPGSAEERRKLVCDAAFMPSG